MFGILDRHIARSTTLAFLAVLFAILSLLSIFNLIEELQEDASGYTAASALEYVLLTMPRRFQDVLPYSLFLGALIGMGTLSGQNEITVMRAAGVSVLRLFGALLLPLGFWVVVGFAVSEIVAPYAEKRAEIEKLQLKRGTDAIRVYGGHWFRDEALYMQISAIDEDGALIGVTQYWLANDGRVSEIVSAGRAVFDAERGDRWQLEDVLRTRWVDSTIEVDRPDSLDWRNPSRPELIEAQAFIDPHKMSVAELQSQINYASSQGLGDVDYRLALWAKLFQPLSVFGLALLAVVFTVGALREVGIGARLLAGILVGLSFKYLQDLFAPMSVVYGLSPLVAVSIPIAVCWLVGVIGVRRIA